MDKKQSKKEKALSEYGPRIRGLCKKYFPKQRDFAEAIGVNETQLGAFMNTTRRPSADNLKKMFLALQTKGAKNKELVELVTGCQ